MATRAHRTVGRGLRAVLLTGLLATGAMAAAPGPVAAGIPGCALTAQKPGGTGLTAMARFKITCIAAAPFQYQVALWERDDGPDQKLSQTPWTLATIPNTFTYKGTGPSVACQTEPGKEELVTKVRARIGAPGNYETTPWKTSAAVTTRTCQ